MNTQRPAGKAPAGLLLCLLSAECHLFDNTLHAGVLVKDPHHIADVRVDAFVVALSVGRVAPDFVIASP